ncbi:hypothetical protein ANCCAN_25405 [Ancylostoma caninum]|uniref:Protein kinase domain-containing protein n=1 Tax=Ancylostoma caninum TaxID=29170 RepID=A0A368FFA5_ANCCA|nr:hypothetical protein ANCCAN_25405 [Ancylostoma caninum]
MLVGQSPFHYSSTGNIVKAIIACKFDIPSSVREEPSNLIKNLIVKDSSKRASLHEVLAHAWIESMSGVAAK